MLSSNSFNRIFYIWSEHWSASYLPATLIFWFTLSACIASVSAAGCWFQGKICIKCDFIGFFCALDIYCMSLRPGTSLLPLLSDVSLMMFSLLKGDRIDPQYKSCYRNRNWLDLTWRSSILCPSAGFSNKLFINVFVSTGTIGCLATAQRQEIVAQHKNSEFAHFVFWTN